MREKKIQSSCNPRFIEDFINVSPPISINRLVKKLEIKHSDEQAHLLLLVTLKMKRGNPREGDTLGVNPDTQTPKVTTHPTKKSGKENRKS